ncbi:putative acetyltransferase [Zopfia rhizophila CBS 207.26]|uniref:Putative acetyltransferase n=1 Tax=Zopfia rhizophila CBS 207.26 TaxID=1314779 RepID=A0A6A6EQV4_9PEZI|nr:putative acetyltransferase [Zopfia rhizophila CBS 207.26]KAF2193088.1 putative acetyltransferase [Zopfia rhizophila CBS 207.26]
MSDNTSIEIIPVEFPRDHDTITALFTSYANSLGIDLSFQNFSYELSALPGKYSAEQGGALFLARSSSSTNSSSIAPSSTKVIGCVALRSFTVHHSCEIKRLYIEPGSRGLGAGRKLLERVLERARELGYREVLLDTLPSMVEAKKMYRRFRFKEVEAYYESPIEGTCFMRLELGNEREVAV